MTDKIHYLRIPNGMGARAEMVRMAYVLAKRPYVDVFHDFANAGQAVGGKNPYKQFPFVETDSGEVIYQTLAGYGAAVFAPHAKVAAPVALALGRAPRFRLRVRRALTCRCRSAIEGIDLR